MGNSKWTIGRADLRMGDILINDSTVSAEHAFLYFIRGIFYIQDNESTNGTFIERSGKKVRIKAGELFPTDIIYFGKALKHMNDLINFPEGVQPQVVTEKELVVIKKNVGYQSKQLRLFESNNIHASHSGADIKPRKVEPKPRQTSSSSIKNEKPINDNNKKPTSSAAKQKCSDCGMVIVQDLKCPYCGNL